MIAAMVINGTTTERIPAASPAIITVAGPVFPASAMPCTVLPPVKYSVVNPMMMPPTAPLNTAPHTLTLTPSPVMTA